ncbi:MAG: pilus assembly protein PilM [Planctomycetota bacterium]
MTKVFTRPVNVPVINPKKMHTMVELEAKQQIPGNFDEVEWGYHSSPAADETSLDVALFAVKREVIQTLITKCKTVGINLAGVSVPSLALYNFIKFDQQFPDGEAVIILDVGADNTDLVVYQGDQLWMRSLPVSGNDITNVFAKKFRVSLPEAEVLKRQVNDSRQSDKIIRVIESGLTDLVSEVNRSLGFYRSQNPNATLDNLVISGNTFRLPGLPEYMAEKLRLTVNILEDLDRIQVAPGIDRSHFMQDLQSLGVAMGLGLQATGAARADLNLMPKGMQTQRVLDSKRWAAAAVVAILAGTVYLDYSMVSSADETNMKLATQVAESSKANTDRGKKSREVLARVQQLAPELARFDAIGAKQYLTHAILLSVTKAVEDVARSVELRPVPAAAPAVAPTTDIAENTESVPAPPLQAAYLHSIDIPRPSVPAKAGGIDPFRPLQFARTVTVQVDIPAEGTNQDQVRDAIDKSLRELPAPSLFGGPARPLFASVDNQQGDGVIKFFYHDELHMKQDGTPDPRNDPGARATRHVTWTCTIAAEAQP